MNSIKKLHFLRFNDNNVKKGMYYILMIIVLQT